MEVDDGTYINGFRYPVILPDSAQNILRDTMEKYRIFAGVHKRYFVRFLKDKLRLSGYLEENGKKRKRIKDGNSIRIGNNGIYPKGGNFSLLFIKLEIFFEKQNIVILLPAPDRKYEIPLEEYIRIRKQKEGDLEEKDIKKIIFLITVLNDCLQTDTSKALVSKPPIFLIARNCRIC